MSFGDIYIGKLDNDEITQKSLQDLADIEEVHNLCAYYSLLLHCTCNDEGVEAVLKRLLLLTIESSVQLHVGQYDDNLVGSMQANERKCSNVVC